MKLFLALIGLLSVHQAVSECVDDFTFGFQDKKLHAVENGPFTYCIVAVCGVATSEFSFNVRRSYQSELPDQVTVLFDSFTILSGFNSGDLPLCITVNAANNNCLDSGDAVLLEIQELSSPDEFPVDVSVAVDCGNSEVNVFDDDVIEFEIKEDENIIYADEGDSSAEVCVHVTCVDGPTKRSVPILFYNIAVPELAERQKKIVLIPKGTEDGDKVCCTFQLDTSFDVPDDETEDISVHVKSEDLNVLGQVYATIRVHDVDDTDCDVCFIDDTPESTGTQIRIRLPPCVTDAICTLPGISVSCNGQVDTILDTPRSTYLTLTVSVTTPMMASPMSLSRRLRTDSTTRCDSHLINKGFVDNEDGTCTLEFEGTGGTGGPITTFYCTVESPMGTIMPPDECNADSGEFVKYTFPCTTGTAVYVTVVPDPPTDPSTVTCSNTHTRVYHFTPPDIISEP